MAPPVAFSLRIVLLGAGRVAGQLAPALQRAGHRVLYIWSRTTHSATVLASAVPGAQVLPSLDVAAYAPADVYLLAVPDAAIPELLARTRFPVGAIVAHTSGTVPLSVVKGYSGLQGGVFYPLQTFSPGRPVDWQTVPLCVEGATPVAEATLLALAGTISATVRRIGTSQRQTIHVAAVFAGNFTNHLLGISEALLEQEQLPLPLLAPLLRETVEKALACPPFTVQTGPAARHDESTLDWHRVALSTHPRWLEIYNVLTASIQQQSLGPSTNNEGPTKL